MQTHEQDQVAPRRYGARPAAGVLPDGTHPGAVHLQISDLPRSIEYYTRILGMQLQENDGSRARLGPHGDAATLVHLVARPGVARAPRSGRFGLYHFAILLPERAALGRFAAHIMRTGARPAMADHAVSEALYLYDPDGLGIEVYADRPRSAWATRGDELVMVTEPLDLADVIAAGHGTAWTGMPAGTTMGHVHLHVGDVHAAEAFYHAALGFEKTVWSYPGALFMSAGGYHHHLAVNTWSAGPSAPEHEARLLEWELVVPESADANIEAQRLARAGFEPEVAGDASWTTRDPWGTRLRVLAEEAKEARAA